MDKKFDFYKILRIIFLTLAIFSLVFTLAKKVGICASDSQFHIDDLPLPYGDSLRIAASSEVYQELESNFNTWYGNMVREAGNAGRDVSSSPFVVIYYTDRWNFSHYAFLFFDNSHTCVSLPSPLNTSGDLRFQNYFWCEERWGGSSYISSYEDYVGNSGGFSVSLSSLLTAAPGGGFIVTQDTTIPYYPLYVSETLYDSPSASAKVVFSKYESLDPEVLEGIATQMTTLVDIGSQVTSSDTSLDLWVKLRTWLSNIVKQIHDGYTWLYNNFVSLFTPFFKTVTNFITWCYEHLSPIGAIASLIQTILEWLEDYSGVDLSDLDLSDVVDAIEALPSAIYSYFSSWFSGFFTNLLTTLDNWFSYNHLPDWLKTIYRVFKGFYDLGLNENNEFSFIAALQKLLFWDHTTFTNQLKNSTYGTLVINAKTTFSAFINAITSAVAPEHLEFSVNLGTKIGYSYNNTTVGGHDLGTITFDFDWYQDIKDIFLPLFFAFVYGSTIFAFIKSLPGILQGTSGVIADFVDHTDRSYETFNTTYTNSGMFTSQGFISNHGRNRIYVNDFVSGEKWDGRRR